MSATNPYSEDNGELILFELFPVVRGQANAGRDRTMPTPDFGAVLLQFPPAGEVSISREINIREEENKDSGAMVIEAKKNHKPIDISFTMEIIGDEDAAGNVVISAFEKKQMLDAYFGARDAQGRPLVYAPRYPLLPADVDPLLVVWTKFTAKDTVSADLIVADVAFHQWVWSPPKATGKGSNSGDSSDGSDDEYLTEAEIEARNEQRIRDYLNDLNSDELDEISDPLSDASQDLMDREAGLITGRKRENRERKLQRTKEIRQENRDENNFVKILNL